jgi:hypothetical protein
MVTCSICERTLLLGENFAHWRADGAGTEQVVCRLCEDEAERRTTLNRTWHARKVA